MAVGDILTELLQHFQVLGYEHWGEEEDAVVSASPAEMTGDAYLWPVLRSAVRSHPVSAHQALAVELGLDYDKIEANESTPTRHGAVPTRSGEENIRTPGRKRPRVDSTEAVETERASTTLNSSKPNVRRTRRKITR
ncbi:MAG: hypothetical protein Q9226_009416 [Calogaya cf. arnoldii]